MLRRSLRVFSAEMAKTWRTKFPYLGLGVSVLIPFLARQTMAGFQTSGDGITAPAYFTAAVNMNSTLIIPIFATIFAAMLVASEASRGSLRTMLTRPIARTDFLTGKLMSGAFYLLMMFLVNVVTALLIARNYPLRASFDRVSTPEFPQLVSIYAIALALTFLPLLAAVSFGFMISVFSASVATAIGVAVGLLLTIQTAKDLIPLGNFKIGDYVFLSYLDTAMGIADSKASGVYEIWNQSSVKLLVATSLATIVVCIALSYRSFLKRDLNS
jgi:ABC-2 type transport system permease protein